MADLEHLRLTLPWWEQGNLSAIPAPPGLKSNFVDPYSKDHWNVVTIAVCLTAATLLIIMRMFTKLRVLKNPGWDDYTALIAYFGLIVYTVISRQADKYGGGRHLWNVTGYNFVVYARYTWATEIIYGPCLFFTKFSIILLYLRVFKPMLGTAITLHVVLWANFTFYLIGIFIQIFQCIPIQKAWYPLMEGHCVDQQATQTSSAVINSISDVIILLLPCGSILHLKVHKKGKIGLFVIFSFGLFGCISSITRAVLFAIVGKVGPTVDGTWIYYPLNLLSTAEISCGLICSCLPAIPAFLRYVSGFQIKIIVTNERKGGKRGYRAPNSNGEYNSSFGNSAYGAYTGTSQSKSSNKSRSHRGTPSPYHSASTHVAQIAVATKKKQQSMDRLTTTSIGGGRPLPPLPHEREKDYWGSRRGATGTPNSRIHEWHLTSSASISFKAPHSNSESVGLALGSPRAAGMGGGGGGFVPGPSPGVSAFSPQGPQSPESRWGAGGRDPYDELDDLDYVKGDEWRSPSDTSPSPTGSPDIESAAASAAGGGGSSRGGGGGGSNRGGGGGVAAAASRHIIGQHRKRSETRDRSRENEDRDVEKGDQSGWR